MGIFSRLSDIVNANLVAILDHAEDPEKMVRLMIHEMEETLVEVKTNAAKVIADQKTLERNISELAREEAEWLARAELALKSDREDLAKAALEEKNKRIESKLALEKELETVKESVKKFAEDIVKLDAKLAETKQKKQTLIVRSEAARSQKAIRKKLDQAASSRAFARFENMERNLDRIEGELEAQTLRGEPTLESEFANLENREKIDSELAQLKQKIMGTKPGAVASAKPLAADKADKADKIDKTPKAKEKSN